MPRVSFRKRHLQGKVEAAGIEPASGTLPNSPDAGTFHARFDFGEAESIEVTPGAIILVNEFYEHAVLLEEAIPQLERLLETAKLVYYGAQEVS